MEILPHQSPDTTGEDQSVKVYTTLRVGQWDESHLRSLATKAPVKGQVHPAAQDLRLNFSLISALFLIPSVVSGRSPQSGAKSLVCLEVSESEWKEILMKGAVSILPGGQLTLLEPLGDLARGQPSPIEPGGLAGEVLLFIKS